MLAPLFHRPSALPLREPKTQPRRFYAPQEAARLDAFLRPQDVGIPLIRMGAFGDGGYLVPDDLRDIAACFSPGVSEQASFEMDMAKRGVRSYMADASVEAPPESVPGARFIRKFLGPKSKGDVLSLQDWVASVDLPDDADLLLQIDIEGAEYATLAAAPPDLLRRFRMIVMEWHFLPSCLTKPRFQRAALAMVDKLSEDFVTVHLHTNNVSGVVEIEGEQIPRVIETTMLRKDRIDRMTPVETLPHPLDARHAPRKADLPIPARWLGSGRAAG